MTAWPSGLPQQFERAGFTQEFENGVLKTEMDAGPPKRRLLFTFDERPMSGTMLMTGAQVGVLRTFYTETVKQVLPFDFVDPVTTDTVSVIFDGAPKVVPANAFNPADGSLMWRVSLAFAIQG